MSKLPEPSYCTTSSLFAMEKERAFLLAEELRQAIRKTAKKTEANQVHKLRVILRRWYSIWEILKEHSWQSKSYKEKMGKNLKKLNKALGQLRDLDVNIENAKKYRADSTYLKELKVERAQKVHQLEMLLKEDENLDLGRQLKIYLKERADKLEASAADDPGQPGAAPQPTGYEQIDALLQNLEEEVRGYAAAANSVEDFHKLRLTIKEWRYLLSEFLGVSHLTLVKAQGLLGKHQDLNRLREHLAQSIKSEQLELAETKAGEKPLTAAPPPYKEKQSKNLSRLALEEIERDLKNLEAQIPDLIRQLPYGMRPYSATLKLPDSTLAK